MDRSLFVLFGLKIIRQSCRYPDFGHVLVKNRVLLTEVVYFNFHTLKPERTDG